MDDLRFYVLFKGSSVISGWWEFDNKGCVQWNPIKKIPAYQRQVHQYASANWGSSRKTMRRYIACSVD